MSSTPLATTSYHSHQILPLATVQKIRSGDIDKDILVEFIKKKLAVDDKRSVTLEAVSNCLFLSKRTFHRRLNDKGLKFRELISEAKLELAKESLLEGAHSISDIGRIAGYTDPSNFSKAFKLWTGLTPREYRKALC